MKLDALIAATGIKLTQADYEDWLDGGYNYDKFDAAVRAFLGPDLYDAGERTARLDGVLHAILAGQKKATIGGMAFDFTKWEGWK